MLDTDHSTWTLLCLWNRHSLIILPIHLCLNAWTLMLVSDNTIHLSNVWIGRLKTFLYFPITLTTMFCFSNLKNNTIYCILLRLSRIKSDLQYKEWLTLIHNHSLRGSFTSKLHPDILHHKRTAWLKCLTSVRLMNLLWMEWSRGQYSTTSTMEGKGSAANSNSTLYFIQCYFW